MILRPEKEEDHGVVKALNKHAFQGEVESSIVEKVRSSCDEVVSLVAVEDSKVVGHIFFSPVVTMSGESEVRGMALAPIAVSPEYQRRGIGSALVKEGLRVLNEGGYPFVVVLGHKDYFPRFGFEKASKYGLRSEWDGIPDDVFMVLFLDRSIEESVAGVVTFRPEFG